MARFFVSAGSNSVVTDIPFVVIELLSQFTDKYAVFLGTQFERQADILIFTPNAIHLIEVKDKKGTIVVDDKNRWFVDGEPIVNVFAGREENPPTQAQNTAWALEKALKRIYRKAGKEFKGKIFPYVLVPNTNEISRANLSKVRYGWVWVLTSLKELPDAIVKRDRTAVAQRDFAFSAGDIEFIAQNMRMVPTGEINGVKVSDKGIEPRTSHSTLQDEQSRPFASEKREPQAWSFGKPILWVGIPAFLIGVCIFIGAVLLVVLRGNLAGLVSSTLGFPSRPTIWITSPSPMPISTPIPVSNPTISHSAIGKWSAVKNGLNLTVDKIEISDNGFLVWMTAVNNTSEKLSLPLFGYFFVVDDLGNQYEADPFSSSFPTAIAPGATVSGYARMTRQLDSNATRVKVTFTQVFGSLSIDSISIDNIPVR